MNIGSYWQMVVQWIVLLLAVGIDQRGKVVNTKRLFRVRKIKKGSKFYYQST